MPRRKPSVGTSNADPAFTEGTSRCPNVDSEAAPLDVSPGGPGMNAEADSPLSLEADDNGNAPQRPWRRNFETLAVPEPGIYSGEDRKFAQVYIAFDKERPTDEQKAKMTEAGLRYRSQEKRWDMPSSAAGRHKVKSLVAEFTGVTLGAAPGR